MASLSRWIAFNSSTPSTWTSTPSRRRLMSTWRCLHNRHNHCREVAASASTPSPSLALRSRCDVRRLAGASSCSYSSSTLHRFYENAAVFSRDANERGQLQLGVGAPSSSMNQRQHLSYNAPPLSRQHSAHCKSYFSTLPSGGSDSDSSDDESDGAVQNHRHRHYVSHPDYGRLSCIRNVGIFAHVDAGKTTVTERMLALSGVVQAAGSVDTGDTVTDYLPAERERGITIQSAAVGFDWLVPSGGSGGGNNDSVSINLIDTPGHVDFSVEVHRSVSVLDGAVLVLDAVSGVQAQTETVWRAIRNTDDSKKDKGGKKKNHHYGSHAHEPLPALMFINKMDREGADVNAAMETVRRKLRGSNPVLVQLPLYREEGGGESGNIVAGRLNSSSPPHDEFVGVLDLINMRAILYPDDAETLSVEDAAPTVISLTQQQDALHPSVLDSAQDARRDLISNLADVDEVMEDLYLHASMSEEEEGDGGACPIIDNIPTSEIRSSLRRMTLERKIMPTMCGAALRGVGVEPVLDSVAEYLPCPLDRLPPQLRLLGNANNKQHQKQKQSEDDSSSMITLGHPLHSSVLAYVFKVLHMKGRGGSGDGRVAFARVYSGTLKARDSVRVISPTLSDDDDGLSDDSTAAKGNKKQKHPVERIGGMLELSGGQFGNLPEGSCQSGDVCALIGLKKVVTGDTLLLTSPGDGSSVSSEKSAKGKKKNSSGNDAQWKQYTAGVHLAGLASPKPVLTLRVEANSASEQSRLSAALALLTVEDPSLVVEETPTTTLISGLGELHMEIVLDRLRREHGLQVRTGKPAVAYRETVSFDDAEEVGTDGLVEYDRTVGGVRLHGAVALRLRQHSSSPEDDCIPPNDPVVTLSSETRVFFNLDPSAESDESEHKYPPSLQALLSGVRGSLKRGRLGPYPLANLECHIIEVDSELSSPDALPGAMRAAAANAVSTLLENLAKEERMVILEPRMNVEISVPHNQVGDVLSDLTSRRGTVDDVAMAEEGGDHVKSMIQAEVPLVEILGYANSLRSLTGGEGAFSAEYKGHAPRD